MAARVLPPLDLLVGPDAPRTLPAVPGEAELGALLHVPGDGPLVRANMIASLDGAAWGPDRRSGSINGPADWRVFRVLRALSEVILVGAGTARAEEYRPWPVPRDLVELRAAAGLPPQVEIAVVTRTGGLPPGLHGVDRPPLVCTSEEGAERLGSDVAPERLVVAGGSDVDLPALLDALAARGLTRVLVEGGPELLGALVAADLVDELCLTTSPAVVGAGPGRILGGSAFGEVRPARLAHLLHSDGMLLARWVLDGSER